MGNWFGFNRAKSDEPSTCSKCELLERLLEEEKMERRNILERFFTSLNVKDSNQVYVTSEQEIKPITRPKSFTGFKKSFIAEEQERIIKLRQAAEEHAQRLEIENAKREFINTRVSETVEGDEEVSNG
jgi:hypothetical protein